MRRFNIELSILRKSLDRMRANGILSDMEVLHDLAHYYEVNGSTCREAAQARRDMHKQIAEKAERGKIAMVWSGMDCDCVLYQGDVRIVDADCRTIEASADSVYSWADGPCGYYLERPSVAHEIRYKSRDLALEAFEDGHPHSIHPWYLA